MRLEQVLEDALAARVTRGVDGLDLDLGAHAEERVDAGQQLALGGGRERPLTAHPDHIHQQVRAVAHEYFLVGGEQLVEAAQIAHALQGEGARVAATPSLVAPAAPCRAPRAVSATTLVAPAAPSAVLVPASVTTAAVTTAAVTTACSHSSGHAGWRAAAARAAVRGGEEHRCRAHARHGADARDGAHRSSRWWPAAIAIASMSGTPSVGAGRSWSLVTKLVVGDEAGRW